MHELSSRVSGVVLEPGDPGFAEEAAGFNLAIQHAPQLLVGAASEDDVVEAVRYAAAHGMPGGSSRPGTATTSPSPTACSSRRGG